MAANTSQTDMDALREELNTLRGDVGKLTETLKHMAEARGNEAYDRLRESAAAAGQRVHETADEARARVRHTADLAAHQVEERPLTSVMVAFGIGMLLGILFDRRT